MKLLVCTLTLFTLTVNGQLDSYWSPYASDGGASAAAVHYGGPAGPAARYPYTGEGSPIASDANAFYNHHYGPQTRGPFTSPLMSPAYGASSPYLPAPVPPPSAIGGARHTCGASSPPKIDWGDCPSLESKEEDKKMKEEKQKECMKNLELNENTTFNELTSILQNRVRECTLRKDELLNEAGKYNYEKAMEKLKAKSLPENLTKKVEEAHVECKIEAEQKFRSSVTPLAEVDSYNECMDFHLAMLCKIKVISNDVKVSNVNSFHGIVPMPYASPANVHSPHDFGGVMNKISILSQALKR